MSNEMELQARLLFQKTMFEYLNFLESNYLTDTTTVVDQKQLNLIHRRANDKMTLINHSLKRYGMKGIDVPKFVNIIGNC